MDPKRLAQLLADAPKLNSFPKKSRSFLVPGVFPFGSITIIDGDPGMGKSNISQFLAAQHSIGGTWPGELSIPEGNTLIIDVENDPSYDTLPRIEANGGDSGNIQVLRYFKDPESKQETLFQMPKHLDYLREQILAFEYKLVIIDTIMGHIDSSVKANNDQDVRRILLPLSHLAAELNICIVLLRHLNKSSEGTAVKRGSGSIAFSAVARNGFLVAADPNDESLKHFVHVKTNTGKFAVGRTFKIKDCEQGGCSVEWLGISAYTANQLCRATGIETEKPDDRDCSRELREFLKTGPVRRSVIDEEFISMGFSSRAVDRALKCLKAVPEKSKEFAGGFWTWRLPGPGDAFPQVIFGS
jgi:putative DNA primase/helicase